MRLFPHRQHLTSAFVLAVLACSTPTAALACGGGTTASATECATPWGSLAKSRAHPISRQVTDVRSGRHHCFDRLVVDLGGAGEGGVGYRVEYRAHVVADGSGRRVPLRGGARLSIIVDAPTYDVDGDPTYRPADRRELVAVDGYRTFRQVAWAGTFEGQTTIGLGVRARLPLRVFVLRDPDGSRLVIDVAHTWS